MSNEAPNKHNLWLNIWTDFECGLLLNTALSYKNEHSCLEHGWEQNEERLDDICLRFMVELSRFENLSSNDDISITQKFSKEQVRDKLKMVHRDFQNFIPIDKYDFLSDNNSHANLCRLLWGEPLNKKSLIDKHVENYSNIFRDEEKGFETTNVEKFGKEKRTNKMRKTVKESAFDEQKDLCESKYSKSTPLKYKTLLAGQHFSSSKHNMALKAEVLKKLDEHRKRHQNEIDMMISRMEQQTKSIADGFSLIKALILPESKTGESSS